MRTAAATGLVDHLKIKLPALDDLPHASSEPQGILVTPEDSQTGLLHLQAHKQSVIILEFNGQHVVDVRLGNCAMQDGVLPLLLDAQACLRTDKYIVKHLHCYRNSPPGIARAQLHSAIGCVLCAAQCFAPLHYGCCWLPCCFVTFIVSIFMLMEQDSIARRSSQTGLQGNPCLCAPELTQIGCQQQSVFQGRGKHT